MPLITEKSAASFDLTRIKRGNLLWGRHFTWNEGKAGFVTSAAEERLIVQYYPGIGNVTNHFVIPVSEAAEGQWEIRWSADMSEVWECNTEKDKERQETEGDEGGDAGRVDL